MSTHQQSTLPVLVIPQETRKTVKKRYMFYLTATVTWMFVAFVVIGYNNI